MDNDRCPKDEKGEYDFEAVEALDLPYLNDTFNTLLDGGTA